MRPDWKWRPGRSPIRGFDLRCRDSIRRSEGSSTPAQSCSTWRATSAECVRKPTWPSPLDRLEAGSGDRGSEGLLTGRGDDDIPGPAQDERRGLDLPEAVGDVEPFEHGEAAGHHALIGLPASLDHEPGRAGQAGWPPWNRLKNWLTNGLLEPGAGTVRAPAGRPSRPASTGTSPRPRTGSAGRTRWGSSNRHAPTPGRRQNETPKIMGRSSLQARSVRRRS